MNLPKSLPSLAIIGVGITEAGFNSDKYISLKSFLYNGDELMIN